MNSSQQDYLYLYLLSIYCLCIRYLLVGLHLHIEENKPNIFQSYLCVDYRGHPEAF